MNYFLFSEIGRLLDEVKHPGKARKYRFIGNRQRSFTHSFGSETMSAPRKLIKLKESRYISSYRQVVLVAQNVQVMAQFRAPKKQEMLAIRYYWKIS